MSEVNVYQLLTSEVMSHWDLVSGSIKASLPPMAGEGSEALMSRIQQGILEGEMEVWGMQDAQGMVALAVLVVQSDPFGSSKDLLIYSLYSIRDLSPHIRDGAETLKRVALGKGCRRLIFYTMDDNIAKVAQMLGGEAHYFCIIPTE